MLRLLLVRHGVTEANEKQKCLGRGDSPLTDKGRSQIEALEKALAHYAIHGIYASPSERTLETIKGVAKNRSISVEKVEALREIDFGDFEDRTFSWIKEEHPLEIEKMLKEGDAYSYPKGESLMGSYERLTGWIEPILKSKEGQTLLICAHGGTIRNIVSYLLGNNRSLHWHFKIDHASLSVITIEEGFAVCEVLNDTSFLKGIGKTKKL